MLTHDEILIEFALIASDVALKAEPSYWSFKQRDFAIGYQRTVTQLRALYVQIRDKKHPYRFVCKEAARITPGIEGNAFRLLSAKC